MKRMACIIALLVTPVFAQNTPPPDEEPKSLDELLGIDPDEDEAGADDAAAREREDELQRELDNAQIGEAFALAVSKMSMSADLLDESFDTGLGTQRVQEDILAKLDQIIEAAKKQQNQGSSSSSSSSSSNPQDGQQDRDPGQQQRQQNQDNQAQQRQQQPGEPSEGDPPPREDGDINMILEETRTEWGALPERVRNMLLQGRQEQFSSLYERLTREYYKRLAEEGTP